MCLYIYICVCVDRSGGIRALITAFNTRTPSLSSSSGSSTQQPPSSSSPPFTNNQTSQSYNPLVRTSSVNIDETTSSLAHPYGAYAEYAASYYSRHAMVLDPESLQLYRSGLLSTDPTSTAAFRVTQKLLFMLQIDLIKHICHFLLLNNSYTVRLN